MEDKTPRIFEHILLDDILITKNNTTLAGRSEQDLTPAALADLAASIKEHGILQPILVRIPDKGQGYELVAGERRVRATMLAGLDKIPAYIVAMSEEEAIERQIIENLHREGINPMREAQGFKLLIRKGYTTKKLADKLGKSMDYVQERLKLCELIPQAQELVASGEMPLKAGLKMARIPEKQQKDAFDNVTDTIYLEDKTKGLHGPSTGIKKTVFSGLNQLQEWMDQHLWTEIRLADFDITDPSLNPQMGSCEGCKHRTTNTGGLFNDVTLEDKCLLASCYRAKQVATYKKTFAAMVKKYPGRRIVYRERTGHTDARELFKKQLTEGEIKSSAGGVEISEKEFLKGPKEAECAVLIGITRSPWGDHKLDKKTVIFTKPRPVSKPTVSKLSAKDQESQEKAKAKQKLDEELDAYKSQELIRLKVEYITRKDGVKSEGWLDAFRFRSHTYINESLSFDLSDWDLVAIFKALGFDWVMNGKLVSCKTYDLVKNREEIELSYDDVERTLEDLDAKDLDRLDACVFALSQAREAKAFKIPEKDLEKKANSAMQSWKDKRRAKELEDLKSLGSKKPKPGKPGGLAELIGKPQNYGQEIERQKAARKKRVAAAKKGGTKK